MSTELIDHIRKFIPLTDEDALTIAGRFKVLKLKKKAIILEEGALCNSIYFVNKGCLRMYFLKKNGTEQTISFALENWWLTDLMAFQAQTPATYAIQAIEPTEVLAINLHTLDQLLAEFPTMEKYFRLIHQRAASAAQRRISYLYDLSREELYLKFAALYPAFIQRVPQYLLASFLGFTPEYLSEIRRKRG